MKHSCRIIAAGLLCLMMSAYAAAQGNLNDPYEILNRHLDANGGLERLKAEKTIYEEGQLSVAGLSGPIKIWAEKPDKSRVDIDLGILKMTQGDNGQFQWTLDTNGKLQKTTKSDEASLKRKEVTRKMAGYEHIDPDSDVFDVSIDGTEKVNDAMCYILTVTNNINNDKHISFINAKTFMLEKSTSLVGENSNDSYYDDYREVDGIMVAFWTREVDHQTGQEQIVKLSQHVSNPEIEPSMFEPPEEEGKKDFRFTSGNSSENVPFHFIGNHIYFPVVVDCKERLWVLDTGAGVTVLEKAFADELGLELKGDMKGKGAGGTVEAQFTTLPGFSLQGIEFDEQMAAVIDMSALIRLLGVDIAGILGYDFLSRFVTRVDYAAETISFYDPETFEYNGGGNELDVHLKNGVFDVRATLDGEHSGSWLFDLGAGSCSLHGAYALIHGYADKKGIEGLGHGAGNAYSTKNIKCKTIEMAGFTVDNPNMHFSYGGQDTTFNEDRIGGLGNTLFRNFVLYCDYARERIIVEKGANFNKPFPEDRSGLRLTRSVDGEIEAIFVSPDTPAASSGFEIGDVIRSINGIDIGCFDGILAIREMLRADAGTEYKFVVDRGGDARKLNLKLADLY